MFSFLKHSLFLYYLHKFKRDFLIFFLLIITIIVLTLLQFDLSSTFDDSDTNYVVVVLSIKYIAIFSLLLFLVSKILNLFKQKSKSSKRSHSCKSEDLKERHLIEKVRLKSRGDFILDRALKRKNEQNSSLLNGEVS